MKPTHPLLSPTTAARLAQLDRELDLAAPSFAETILSAALENIKNGDHSLILEGYVWEHGQEWAETRMAALVESWKAEDAATMQDQPDPATVSAIAAQLEAQDAQERAQGRASTPTLTEAANAQGGRK
jgi:hypothetical protein